MGRGPTVSEKRKLKWFSGVQVLIGLMILVGELFVKDLYCG